MITITVSPPLVIPHYIFMNLFFSKLSRKAPQTLCMFLDFNATFSRLALWELLFNRHVTPNGSLSILKEANITEDLKKDFFLP